MCGSKGARRANTIRRKRLSCLVTSSYPGCQAFILFVIKTFNAVVDSISVFAIFYNILFSKFCRVMASLQDIELLQDVESLLQNVDPLFEDLQPLTSALTTSFQESIAIISSALFDTSSDLTTTFFTVLLMVLVATMARMVFEGRTTPATKLEKRQVKSLS